MKKVKKFKIFSRNLLCYVLPVYQESKLYLIYFLNGERLLFLVKLRVLDFIIYLVYLVSLL